MTYVEKVYSWVKRSALNGGDATVSPRAHIKQSGKRQNWCGEKAVLSILYSGWPVFRKRKSKNCNGICFSKNSTSYLLGKNWFPCRNYFLQGIIFHLTFRLIDCIFIIILAGLLLLRYAMPYGVCFCCILRIVRFFRKAVASLAIRRNKAERGIHNAEPDRKSGIAGKSK